MRCRARSRRLGAPLLVAAVVAVPSACGAQPPSTRADGVAVARYEPTGDGGDAALLTGVAEAEGGCLVVRPGAGSEAAWVPVFAADDDVPVTLVVGDDVELGGGQASRSADWDLPPECPPDGPFWLVRPP